MASESPADILSRSIRSGAPYRSGPAVHSLAMAVLLVAASFCSVFATDARGADLELAAADAGSGPALLGLGDALVVKIEDRPELTTTTTIAGDGTIVMPLIGAIKVAGLSAAAASARIALALRNGQFLNKPAVTIQQSQRVSVLGEVATPGRFPIESRTTIFDLMAQAGGVTADAGSVVFLLRSDKDGKINRYPIDLRAFTGSRTPAVLPELRGGDSVFVPRVEQFYIRGEVGAPNMYRLEPGMTVEQALTRGGGVTARGSERRIEITRVGADQKRVSHNAELGELIRANDIIRVKERIF